MSTFTFYVDTDVSPGGAGTSGDPCATASEAEGIAGTSNTATDDYVILCHGATDDTTQLTINFDVAPTTGSIKFQADPGEPDGFYDGDATISDAHYKMSCGNVVYAVYIVEPNVTIDGFQIVASHTANFSDAIRISGVNNITLTRNRLYNAGGATGTDNGIGSGGTTVSGSYTRTFTDNLIVGFQYGMHLNVSPHFSPTFNIYHNTIYGTGGTSYGIRMTKPASSANAVFNLYGNAFANHDSGASFDTSALNNATVTYAQNVTEDYDLGTTSEVDLVSEASAWTSPSVSESSDFTIKDASSALNFTVSGTLTLTDVRGNTRTNHSAGCFEFVSSGTSYTITPSGGITLSGSVSVTRDRTIAVSGGITMGGTASDYETHNSTMIITPSGGVVMGGDAAITFGNTAEYIITPSGGIVLSGSAAISRDRVVSVSGGITLGGTASDYEGHNVENIITPSGGIFLSGSSSMIFTSGDFVSIKGGMLMMQMAHRRRQYRNKIGKYE